MKTDKELLELAAKSIGLAQPWSERAQAYRWSEGSDWIEWNPLTNNSDAFTTMVKLGLLVFVRHGSDRTKACVEVVTPHPLDDISLPFACDGVDATRRAIVVAAAAIGETP